MEPQRVAETRWVAEDAEFASAKVLLARGSRPGRSSCILKQARHRKPHQGIGGLCPADRYFEIQSELRKTMKAGIQENLLEMALRGQRSRALLHGGAGDWV